jgi:flagellar export protein FliJ
MVQALKSLGVLKRLAKLAVDQERQALVAIGNEIQSLEGEIRAARETIGREAAASPDFMTSGVTLPAFIQASKLRISEMELRIQALGQAFELQLERVRQQRVEEKRYERLAERRAEQAEAEAAAKEQKAIEELVACRHGRSA